MVSSILFSSVPFLVWIEIEFQVKSSACGREREREYVPVENFCENSQHLNNSGFILVVSCIRANWNQRAVSVPIGNSLFLVWFLFCDFQLHCWKIKKKLCYKCLQSSKIHRKFEEIVQRSIHYYTKIKIDSFSKAKLKKIVKRAN